MSTTNIEWTDRVWNPVTGCTKVSPGCKHCYAEGVARRFWHHQYVHTAERGFIPVKAYAADHMTGTLRKFTDVMTHQDRLLEPLLWRKPQRVFVNSMSDLFHEDVPDAFIDQVFAVMGLASQHTFQVLTKRPERMRDYCRTLGRHHESDRVSLAAKELQPEGHGFFWTLRGGGAFLPNVWLGVSVEDQQRADERIPLLLQTPAAVRFISAEPLLGSVDLERVQWPEKHRVDVLRGGTWELRSGFVPSGAPDFINHSDMERIDWVIVGGESGPGARPCNVEWVRGILHQCQASDVPVFVKQLGAVIAGVSLEGPPLSSPPRREGFLINWTCRDNNTFGLGDRKGGDPFEWPEDLDVREFPR